MTDLQFGLLVGLGVANLLLTLNLRAEIHRKWFKSGDKF